MRRSLLLGSALALALGASSAAQAQSGQQSQTEQRQSPSTQSPRPQAQSGQRPGEGADITVQQPAPDITVQQPAPDVVVEQPTPDVTVRQAQPDVTVQQAEPNVSVQQAEPNVSVQRQGEPNVTVVEPEGTRKQQPTTAQGREVETERTVTGSTGGAASGATIGMAQAENLIGKSVQGGQGEELGDVEDLLVNRTSGEIEALVLNVGGFLGIGDKKVRVPWNEAQYNPADESLVVSMSKEELESAQEFDPQAMEAGMVGLRGQQ